MKKLLLFAFILCCFSFTTLAQAILTPLTSEQRSNQSINYRNATSVAAVGLPFFDDFATVTNNPDPSRWINGGVYINNRFASGPITKNVATLDGVNAVGQPYLAGATSPGPSDTLTSQPVRLGTFSPADSVYLSFYWQSGGLGDVPDRTVENTFYLVLEFKDNTGNWQQVWRQNATGEATDFVQVFVGLKDARYFHNEFEFRFRNIGRRSGLLDIWNLDYIELNQNRRKGQNTTRDIAISQMVTPLLENYTAMPLHQFLEDPAAALADSVSATVNNLGNVPGAISWRGFIKRENAATADTFLIEQGLIPANARQYKIAGKPTIANIALPAESFTLVHGFRLNTQEQNRLQAANDTTFRTTTFADYFAYDDGTAEAGFVYPANGNTTQVAMRFELAKPDQVRGFKVYFPRIGENQEGRTITVKVWQDNDGLPGKELHQQSFEIKYTEGANEFYEVELSKVVPVQGIFYLGWSQPASQFINFGFDRNSNAPGSRFLWNSQSNWHADTFLEGAVMMRPLMTGVALGLEDEDPVAAAIQLYPNPTTGVVQVNGLYKAVSVFDVTGRQVYQQQRNAQVNSVDLRHLPAGMYTFRIDTGKSVITKKLILTL
ncbi:T9SS type A sorting domain-containing protein [Pontibacter sp. KCTC 32443]|uniref:T9SS type A sorting domain-containing protein n=1 Tax=Pontibacter TaxID=323449 RepID=UPI00164E18CF|nr:MULTISPECIES: T9SS type A sorting domain-containing protein [Pontibacter]MBC5772867.1 T9SS type A sorting domain-containing protein [Pontibacter sp. KCTC 32443]